MLTEKEKIELFLKGIAGIVAVVGFMLTIAKFSEERRKSNETARIESQKPFYSKQQEIYFDLIETTAFLSNWPDSPIWDEKAKHFWILYWGPVPLVADAGVAKAVDRFSDTLNDDLDGVAMRNASMDLARACRKSLGEAWNIEVQHFPKSIRAGGTA